MRERTWKQDALIDLLEEVGVDKFEVSARNVMVGCLFAPYTDKHKHNYDKNPSLGILCKEGQKNLIHCFTCGVKFRALEQMFKALATLDNDFQQYVKKSQEYDGEDVAAQLEMLAAHRNKKVLREAMRKKGMGEGKYKESFTPAYHPYLERRGITVETAKVWETGFDKKYRRVTFPVRDSRGVLQGAVGRALHNMAEPRYWDYWNFSKSLFLFGEHLVKPDTTLVVVEGIFDTVRAWQELDKEKYSVVAVMGDHPSPAQLEKIVDLSERVTLALDNDKPGRAFTKKLGEQLRRRVRVNAVLWPDDIEDPGDAGPRICGLVEGAMTYTESALYHLL